MSEVVLTRPERPAPGRALPPVSVNVSALVRAVAARSGERPAIIELNRPPLSFAALEQRIDALARGLAARGVVRGTRVLLLVPPSADLFATTFALFRLGAVLVVLDPGMGRKAVLGAIREAEPEVLVGIPKAQAIRHLFPAAFASVRLSVVAAQHWVGRSPTLRALEVADPAPSASTLPTLPIASTAPDELAAILFTSGSTGAPKGVRYTHGIFDAQVAIFREELGIEAGEVDLSGFPLFSLFSLALGATTVVPDMDTAHPGRVDAARVVAQLARHRVTYAFGSPIFWTRLAAHCERTGTRLPGLRRVLMAGAPAPLGLLPRLLRLIAGSADVFTPYGATECLPVTMPSVRALLARPNPAGAALIEASGSRTENGAGTCVGEPLAANRVRIIRIVDGPLLGSPDILPVGKIGEIMVRGPTTTPGYFRRPDDDALARAQTSAAGDSAQEIRHRMGDVGYLDADGRLWFCGRKSQRVETAAGRLFTECCEPVFNQHPGVRRSALVGVGERGAERPVLVVEPLAPLQGRPERTELERSLLDLGQAHQATRAIRTFLFHPELPVDPRHNSKIVREVLATWAVRELHRTEPKAR